MLIDTSGWFCMFDEKDRQHALAVSVYSSLGIRITHSYIIAALVGLVTSRRKSLSKALTLVEDILRDSEIKFIWVDEALTLRALELLKSNRINSGPFVRR